MKIQKAGTFVDVGSGITYKVLDAAAVDRYLRAVVDGYKTLEEVGRTIRSNFFYDPDGPTPPPVIARAFCAFEENVPVDATVQEEETRLLGEYKSKLLIEGNIIPDPFSLNSGWIDEKSMNLWPSIYITDISTYLNNRTPKEIQHRLMNEYKEGKAYRYFSCEWVKEILIHNVAPTSPYCILKAKVSPSQSINNKPYDIWVVVKKDSSEAPGGEILTGYCSCTAGMLGSCNHVAGVLFRIEHAVKTGMTKPTCTSKPCEWNIPKRKTTVKPIRVMDAVWKKSRYNSVRTLEHEKENLEKKNSFTPLTKKQYSQVTDSNIVRNELHHLLAPDVPDSSFCLIMEKRRHKTETVKCPPTLTLVAEEERNSENTMSKEEFVNRISVSDEEITSLNSATIEQSSSTLWKDQRKGRLTASIFQRISTRTHTLKSNENADPSALIKTVMGYNPTISTKSMKHGISLEPCAKKQYTENMRSSHKKFKSENSGLHIYKERPYIAASADLKVECQCCGQGLCEIKCPESIKDQIPTVENVSYIEDKNGHASLKQSHAYYFQVQGQMGVMGLPYCDFFIYTFHGHLTIRINFDSCFWDKLVQDMSWFWGEYIFPELISPSLSNVICDISDKVEKRKPLKLIVVNKNEIKRAREKESSSCKTMLFAATPATASAATLAVTASAATHATTASAAILDVTASVATLAVTASTATHATTASAATLAGTASAATHATTASAAILAVTPSVATLAVTASAATHATTASAAILAVTPSVATLAVTASTATHATSASAATLAGTASAATHATTASAAILAVTPSVATLAVTASTATHATTASAATHATTAVRKLPLTSTCSSKVHVVTTKVPCKSTMSVPKGSIVFNPIKNTKRKQTTKISNKRKCGVTRKPIYLCGVCGKDCIDNPNKYEDESVGCDACSIWVHFVCAGIPEKRPLSDKDEWLCINCR